MPKTLSNELISEIVRLYNLGYGRNTVAKMLGTNGISVLKYLKQLDIPRREGSIGSVNKNPFKDLDSEEVQYWIGWLIADGNVHDKRIGLSITKKDVDVIENYCKFLEIDKCNIKVRDNSAKNWDDLCYVRFGNKETSDFLYDIGITENKSKTINLKTPITFAMLRGMMEGDGCYGYYSNKPVVSYCSASFLLQIKIIEFLNKNNIISNVYKNGNCYQLRISSTTVCNFIKKIYPEDVKLYGERKFNSAMEIVRKYEGRENKNISCEQSN